MEFEIIKLNKKKYKSLFLSCRPKQWIKNLIIFFAPLFSFSFKGEVWLSSSKAFISFCLISSCIYLINDSLDKNKDQKHPKKKFRAIASGLISIKLAVLFSIILFLLSFWIGLYLNNNFFYLLFIYFLIQILYSLFLKNIPLIELFCIASGFIIRSMAGGAASDIYISSWFLLSVGFLSLFLAVEKRKSELLIMENQVYLTRKVLKFYTISLINKFESVLTSCTVITYSLWTYGPIMGGSRSSLMIITIPLVILGIFRYQMLSEVNIDERNKYSNIHILETPENVILEDKPMIIIVFTWFLITIYLGLIS